MNLYTPKGIPSPDSNEKAAKASATMAIPLAIALGDLSLQSYIPIPNGNAKSLQDAILALEKEA